MAKMKITRAKVFPDLHFGSFYPPEPCSGPSKVRGKGSERCIPVYDDPKLYLYYVHSRGNSLEQKSMKLCQNIISHKSKSSSKLGPVGSKNRSLGQIIKKICVNSRGHCFDQKFMKLCQNVNSYKI